MSSEIVAVGVDLGGTWVRLEGVDSQGRRIRSLKAPAPPLAQLPSFVKKRLRSWKIRPHRLIVASRGIWTPSERTHLKHALRALADNVIVMSDVEAAWYAAFGKEGPGVIVIAGTGSIAYGRDAKNHSQRAGGWGPLLGDEGSAFWIGKTWLYRTRAGHSSTRILKLARSPHLAVRRVAGLVPQILEEARQGHRAAQNIVSEAQHHLAELVVQVARELHFKRGMPVSWGGSLLNNPGFRAGFLHALSRVKNKPGRRIQLIHPGGDPALTIARLFKASS